MSVMVGLSDERIEAIQEEACVAAEQSWWPGRIAPNPYPGGSAAADIWDCAFRQEFMNTWH